MRCYYHVYAGGAWREPVAEFIGAIVASGWDGDLRIGMVGPNPGPVIDYLNATGVPYTVCARAGQGWEQVTLQALIDEADDVSPVLYAHSKGASAPSEFNGAWRRSMTLHLMNNWRACIEKLADHEIVGCHWLEPGALHPVDSPFFGGNYWWATGKYLRTLPLLSYANRHEAESWIGKGGMTVGCRTCRRGPPRVWDWTPGWPGWATITPRRLETVFL